MKAYPVEFEVTDEVGDIYANFICFDDESFEVDIKKQILSSDDIRKIADELDKSLKLMKDGV